MQHFIAIIGNRNSGKSTIIKSLTGCPNSGFRGFVHDCSTSRCVYVVCSSPQERDLPADEFQAILKECVSTSSCQGLVMAIQPTMPTRRLSMETIFQGIAASGAFRMHAFMINPGWDGPDLDTPSLTVRLRPFVRGPLTLDGRRFSMINAESVNRVTRIVT